MISRNKRSGQSAWRIAAILSCAAVICTTTLRAGNNVGGAVGGVRVDVDGVASNIDAKALESLKKARQEALQAISADIAKASGMRKVSLRRLAEAIRDHQDKRAGAPLTDDFLYLAGLQRIQFIFVYPEENDIVLAGPAAGWKVNDRAEIVGTNTGLPVLRLDDLLTALQNVKQARRSTISVSIDPTPEGVQRLTAFLKTQTTFNASVKRGVEANLGDQEITLKGVPNTARFAHVLLAADYRLKRYAMDLEPSPVGEMPSYLDLLINAKERPQSDVSPRWWIAADYQPLLTDGERLAWELRPGVKVMSEDERRNADGKVTRTGRANPIAKKWADTMTAKYKELAAKDTIFAELQNCMDLAVTAALIDKHGLAEKAGLDLSIYTENKRLMVDGLPAPKHVKTEVSLAKTSRDWIITASGGIQFSGFKIIENQETAESTKNARAAAAAGKHWWWD